MEALERSPWTPSRQCTAKNRSGERCQRNAIPGGFVCVMHGGRIPAVRESAKQRLLAGADLAIDYLLKLLEPRPPCEACGRSDADRDPVVVKACQLVLDRSGFHPSLNIVRQEQQEQFEGLNIFEIADRAEEMARHARGLADAEAARQLPEAELIEDGVLEDEPAVEAPIPNGTSTPDKRTDGEEPVSG